VGIEKDSLPAIHPSSACRGLALSVGNQTTQCIDSNLVDQRLDLGTNSAPNLFLGS
jgi:hypothetical protein